MDNIRRWNQIAYARLSPLSLASDEHNHPQPRQAREEGLQVFRAPGNVVASG